jgi:hypothetical protein
MDFYKLFNLMISNEDLACFCRLDNVQLEVRDRIRCDNPKVVFALGATKAIFRRVLLGCLLLKRQRIAFHNDF